MKIILAALAMTLGMTAFSQNIINNDEVNVSITGATSRQELYQLRQDLLAVGLDFQYAPQFDNDRKLISIEYTVKVLATGAQVGAASNLQLQNPQAKTSFHISRNAQDEFQSLCFGTCND